MSKKEMEDQEKQWKCEADLRTMVEASKIMADPERKKAAMAEAKKQMDALAKVTKKA